MEDLVLYPTPDETIMSFDLFLACYKNGEPSGMDAGLVRDAFGDAIIYENPEFSLWHLEYGDEANCCDVYVTRLEGNGALVKSLMINRPIVESRLWESLYGIMRLGNVVLFFPGGRSPLFADERAVAHFPSDMIAVLGKPVVIRCGADIRAAIEGNS